MKNPEYLTKDQLKEELLANGVELPTGRVLKSTYVDLYNAHINNNLTQISNVQRNNAFKKSSKKSNQPIVAELSEAENIKKVTENLEKAEAKTKIKEVYIRVTKEDQISAQIINKQERVAVKAEKKRENEKKNKTAQVEKELDLDELTNAEIASRLKSLGQSIGPVTSTTRGVYLQRLAKLLGSGDAVENHEQSESDEEVDVEEIDEPPVTRSVSKRRSMMPSQETKPVTSARKSSSGTRQTRSRVDLADDVAQTEEVEEANQTAKSQNTTATDGLAENENAKPKDKPERRWIPIWLQIAFTILVVLFAYLVVQAMEPNPTPLSLPKGKNN